MRKILLIAVMPLFFACGAKGLNENGNVDADMETYGAGKACVEGDQGGINLCENRMEKKWEIKNLSDTAVHLTCTATERAFVTIDQYYLTAQAFETVPSAGMQNGDNVTCSLWLGYLEGPMKRIFQKKPNFWFKFIYADKGTAPMKVVASDKNNVASISLPIVKGVTGTMASSYLIDSASHTIKGLEEGTEIALANGSSDWVDYQVYSAKSTSETDVRVDYEMCKVSMYIDKDDICSLKAAVNQDTILILVVRAHDVSNGTWSWTDYAIVKIDLMKQEAKVLDKSALHGGLP